MSIVLRILLILFSFITMISMIKKIRSSKVQIEYSIFWILFSVGIIVIAVFPQIVTELAELIGVQSPVNMIFLIIIFILIVRLFQLTVQISQLEYKLKELVQKIAILSSDKNNETKKNPRE